MICSSCRLVNGQAPPGIKTSEELGRWRCGSCGAWNGQESETTQILSSLRQNPGPADATWEPQPNETVSSSLGENGDTEIVDNHNEDAKPEPEHVDEIQVEEAEEPAQEPVRRSTRGKAKQ